MKAPAEKATELYGIGLDRVTSGGLALRGLASHLVVMVKGNGEYAGGLWRERVWPDRTIKLDDFEDYLLKPAREGLGIPDLAWLADVLVAHPEKDERDAALSAVVSEIPDFVARAEAQKRKRVVKEVGAAKPKGGTGANQYTAKDAECRVGISYSAEKRKTSNRDPERIIARLKRDAKTDTRAAALLTSIEAGDIKPYRAAVDMGWVKPPDPARIVEKQREKMPTVDQVAVWKEWGRSLPDDAIDRFAIAQEAFLNLYDTEQQRFLTWARKAMKGAA